MTTTLQRSLSLAVIAVLLMGSAGVPYITRADEASSTPATPAAPTATTTSSYANDVDTQTASSTSSSSTASTTDSITVEQSGGTGTTTTETATSSAPVASTTEPLPPLPVLDTFGTSTEPTTDASTTAQEATTTASTTPDVTPTIQSGTAVALANILNIINTNFVNSAGYAMMLNYVNPVTGAIDLRNASSTLSTGAVCLTVMCMGDPGTTVNLGADGTIDNGIVLTASSGGNTVDAQGGSASIQTGNAYAGLNLINLANTNVVDSNYLLLTMNAFQGVNGDIVFPSLSNFLKSLVTNTGTPSDISLTGTSSVDNNIQTSANSGDNSTTASSSSITTGDAHSAGNVFNQLNANMIGGSNVSILFRVQGDWAGQVFGAPDGLQWSTDDNGHLMLFTASSSTPAATVPGSVSASSTGAINNNVNVIALTGQNLIQNADTALITTGTADAAANVINMANGNIVGRNWILAIVNIFGDFKGNIAFGRPDLWVGQQVSAPSFIENGTALTYKVTVINNGDSDATQAKLTTDIDGNHFQVTSSSVPYTTNDQGQLVWDLGTLPAGKAMEVSFTGKLQGTSYGTHVETTSTVSEHETDNNADDNTDMVAITTSVPHVGTGGGITQVVLPVNGPSNADSASAASSTMALQVTRAQKTVTVNDSTHLAHEDLAVYNPQDATSTPVILHDLLRAPNGALVHDQAWDLGVIRPHEEVRISYNAEFSAKAMPGTYTVASELTDKDHNVLRTFPENGYIVLPGLVALPLTTHAPESAVHAAEHDATSTATSTAAGNTTSGPTGGTGVTGAQAAAVQSGVSSNVLWIVTMLVASVLLIALVQWRNRNRRELSSVSA